MVTVVWEKLPANVIRAVEADHKKVGTAEVHERGNVSGLGGWGWGVVGGVGVLVLCFRFVNNLGDGGMGGENLCV